MVVFRYHRQMFPHVRQDYVERMIAAQQVVYEHGVVITFGRYRKRVTLGTAVAESGDVVIHQIGNATPGNGNAMRVFCAFAAEMRTNIWLSVRFSNVRARRFYEKAGFKHAGSIEWKNGAIPGAVFRLAKGVIV